ncbi:MAG: DUF2855 family protein [Actinomycetota bacterium]|nr:DUF2855 family protein [Actinomycetota bacterium]
MVASWTLSVGRTDLAQTDLAEGTMPAVGDGQALLRVDRVGVTANNVTYGVLGDSFRYWDFFPAEPGRGVVPLWGFAEVIESATSGVEVGSRVFGYLPAASHLVVAPDRPGPRGFRDASPHRAQLPSVYNAYALTSGDSAYEAEREDLQILYRPLFFTSFMLADKLVDNDGYGAEVFVLSSGSSKTAYGTAFLLRETGRQVVGLTSPGNLAFTESLGCYDQVLTYDAIGDLASDVPTAYLDFAGSLRLTAALNEHLGSALVHHEVIGVTHQDPSPIGTLTGTRPTVFFAPEQMRKRTVDWGREGLDERFAAAWNSFAPVVEGWVDVVVQHGPQALELVWLEVLSGTSPPRTGHVLTL